MTVPSLPKLGTPPAPAPLRKIALEEHFGHPIVFMRDSDGRFETRKEASGNFNTQALHCTILTMGADRILFSNDYPYEDYAEGGEFIDTVPISESDRRKIAYANAKALYML
jgi:predicted TIM-barrel fold metal-dependent hydrolase